MHGLPTGAHVTARRISRRLGATLALGAALAALAAMPAAADPVPSAVQPAAAAKVVRQHPAERAHTPATDAHKPAKDAAGAGIGAPDAGGPAAHAAPGTAGELAFGTVPVEVPSYFIDRFPIPPFLLPIYRAAADRYGVPWEVLASINEIETDYGRDLRVSSAGATGWMQFMPASWRHYGLDADDDGTSDPYDPVDAIFAAARYLRAADAARNLRGAILAYRHASWYADMVLSRARFMAGLPSELVDSLAGLGLGRGPVAWKMSFAHGAPRSHARSALRIGARAGAPVVAVQDGKITQTGRSARLGRFVVLQDRHGDRYMYTHLAKLAAKVLVPLQPEEADLSAQAPPPTDPAPRRAASAGSHADRTRRGATSPLASVPAPAPDAAAPSKERLFAHPARLRALNAGGRRQILDAAFSLAPSASLRSYFAGVTGLQRQQLALKSLRAGRHVLAGTILGRVGANGDGSAPHIMFAVRPPGANAPRIDPEPFVEGWQLSRWSPPAATMPGQVSQVRGAGLHTAQWQALGERLARIAQPAVSRSAR